MHQSLTRESSFLFHLKFGLKQLGKDSSLKNSSFVFKMLLEIVSFLLEEVLTTKTSQAVK